ncbi:MAG: hypothetical protein IJB47_08040 [Oscillospiraceae bacterium]|nr:hypothetical protein [Oscillospiraceae bacterium]MBQ4642540.1 hypothetical protein [Oscillospiraceae bacterium]
MEHKLNLDKVKSFISKYRYAALILLIGIVFMLLPERKQEVTTESAAISEQSTENTESKQLTAILEQIQGAGKVQVMLSVAAGEERLYQTDSETDLSGSADHRRVETVIVSDSNRQETGLIRQVNPPVYLGAVVVCEGADRASVRLAVTEAVSKITGLGADCIVVLKMK